MIHFTYDAGFLINALQTLSGTSVLFMILMQVYSASKKYNETTTPQWFKVANLLYTYNTVAASGLAWLLWMWT